MEVQFQTNKKSFSNSLGFHPFTYFFSFHDIIVLACLFIPSCFPSMTSDIYPPPPQYCFLGLFSRSHFPPPHVLTVTQLASQEARCQCANLPLSLSFNKGSSVVKLVQENSPQVKKDELTAPSGKSAVKLPEVAVTVNIIQTNLNITIINDHYHPDQSQHHHCLHHQ